MVGNTSVTLPAALVPALEPGDDVAVSFPDYTPPATRVDYHVNVAFITEAAPQRWLYEKSGAYDRLFRNARRHAPVAAGGPQLRFRYGDGYYRGIPIFFIVPEDAKTRGMDGVRDYVDAHPTDFKDMSQSANAAVDRYSWFSDFLQSVAQGSIDPYASRRRIEDVAASLGAPSGAINGCYVQGGSQADVANCVQTTLAGTQYQSNIEAPTQAQFFGGLAGAGSPLALATYLLPLLDIWKIFVHTGHQEYEYLPTTLDLPVAPAPAGKRGQLLMGLKVPTLRPPAAYSSVLFFTIGDPQAAQTAPVVVNDGADTGMCARSERTLMPLHLTRTSRYVHDTALVITPDGKPGRTIAIDPRSGDAPVVNRSAFDDGSDAGYTVRLAGRFGFTPIAAADRISARIAIPRSTTWSLAPAPNRPPVAGGSLDVIATSAAAPCLSSADLQIGSAPPIPLEAKRLDARRIALHASLQNVPPGSAQIRFYQDDPVHATQIASASPIAIAPKPAEVDRASVPTANLGDPLIALRGTGFENVSGVRLGGGTYTKIAGSSADLACFRGPPIGGGYLEMGQSVSAQLLLQNGSPGDVFVLKLGPKRPALLPASVAAGGATHFSTTPLEVMLTSAAGTGFPARREIRVRRAPAGSASPCEDPGAAPAFGVVPDADTHEATASTLAVILRPAQELGDRAFGVLQLQLVDMAAKVASAWVDVPGTFVRAPDVSRIECPADPALPCTLLGTGLTAVDGVADASGRFVPPDFACRSDDKKLSCLAVPHLPHYTLRLEDSQTTLSVPDSAITASNGNAKPAPTPSVPSPGPS